MPLLQYIHQVSEIDGMLLAALTTLMNLTNLTTLIILINLMIWKILTILKILIDLKIVITNVLSSVSALPSHSPGLATKCTA